MIYEDESYLVIGKCYDVHNTLGCGFLERVYKDALEFEFYKDNIEYEREKKYEVVYKNTVLPSRFIADFVVFNKIMLEVKSTKAFADIDKAKTINYLKVSRLRLALLVNFGPKSLEYERLVV